MATLNPTGLNPLVAQLLAEDEPIQNWAQGTNHLAKALFRGMELRDQKRRENQLSQALLNLPGLGGAPQPSAPTSSPAPSPSMGMPMGAGRPSPAPTAQPSMLPSNPPPDDPTMTVSPRQVAQANGGAQPAPLSFNDRFSPVNTPQAGARPVQTTSVAAPAPASTTTPPGPPRQFDPTITAQIKALTAAKQYDAAMQLYNSERQRIMKPPEFGVVGESSTGNKQYGWIDPQTRTTTPQSPDMPNFVDTKKLRDEVRDLPSYKNLAQAAPVYKSMFEAAGRDNRAADVNLIYGMAKIMDPTSVVRESEMTIAQAVATLPQQMQSQIMSQLNATGRLSPEVRAAIMQEAHSRIQAYQGMFDTDMGMYRGIAQGGRFDPAHVIPTFGPFDQFKNPVAPPGGQSGDGWQTLPGGVRIRPKQ